MKALICDDWVEVRMKVLEVGSMGEPKVARVIWLCDSVALAGCITNPRRLPV